MSIFVNKAEIKDEEIGREMQYHPAGSQESAWYQAAQSLVIRQLLLQQAADAGLCQDPDSVGSNELEEELIDQLLQRDVVVPEADEATCRRYYNMHPDSFVDSQSGQSVSFDQAPMTNGSFTEIQTTSSTPLVFNTSRLSRKLGTCLA